MSINNKEGFILLVSTVIISAVILLIVIGATFRSKEQVLAGFGYLKINQAFNMANLCAEVAIDKLQRILDYAGNETITVNGNSCSILNIEGSGNYNRIIKTQSTVSGYTKKIKVEIQQISFPIIITSWQEVADF